MKEHRLYRHYFDYRSNFEAIRKLFGYTQAELAKMIGTTQNYLTLIETGKGKSTPVIKKVAKLLQINPAFLSESSDAPGKLIFLGDFYVFALKSNDFQPYIFLLKCHSGYSRFIEVVYIFSDGPLSTKPRSSSYPRPLEGVGVKDDRGTIFFFKGQDGRKLDTVILNMTPPSHGPIRGFGRSRFSSQPVFAPDMIERRIKAPAELSNKIHDGTTTRSDISKLFFSPDYFKKLAEWHSNVACR
ncbi:MAG: helix-turn-helix transcriptional regulator [Bacteroidetes bacterium]|nr:helix-turn-helix transcriptional regulator [Bacteroidota bacterium]